MDAVYGSHEDFHCSPGSGVVSERVQNLASSVYREFEVMMSRYGDAVIKDLMPQVVAILENLNQAYREKQEHELELEVLRVEHENLKKQFDREKQARKLSEQKYLEVEDTVDEERKLHIRNVEGLECTIRKLEVKIRNTQEQVSRQEERERDMKDEYNKLHNKYSELFKSHVDYVERTKHQVSDGSTRMTSSATTSPMREIVLDLQLELKSQKSISTSPECTNQIEPMSGAQKVYFKSEISVDDDLRHQEMPEVISDVPPEGKSAISPSLQQETLPTDTVDVGDIVDSGPSTSVPETCVHSVAAEGTENIESPPADLTADAIHSDISHIDEALTWPQPSFKEPDVQSIDAGQDDMLYQQCFGMPYDGNISVLHSVEYDDTCDNLTDDDPQILSADPSLPTLNVSIYDELSEHGKTVLGEVDSGADLTVASVSSAIENIIAENNELIATKNALNIVKDDLIARLDELTGEIDLLKEENAKLQRTVDEKSTKISELDDELRKMKEANIIKQDTADSRNQGHFTRVDLMRVLVERNHYKERLMELQDAVRRADMARAAAKDQQQELTKPAKKKPSLWGLWFQ